MLTILLSLLLFFRRGYNGRCLQITLRQRPEGLLQRLPTNTTAEDRIKALVNSGISLGSIFHTIGPSCLSTDEMFQAMEFKELLARHKKALSEYSVLEKRRAMKLRQSSYY